MKNIKITKVENLKIKKAYMLMSNYREIIVDFIDSGLIKSIKNDEKALLYNTYIDYEDICKDFISKIQDIAIKHKVIQDYKQGVTFNFDFINMTCTLVDEQEIFDIRKFSIGTLELLQQYEILLQQFLQEEVCNEA